MSREILLMPDPSERVGHTSFMHYFTHGMVATLLSCNLAVYWEVIPL